MTEIISGIQIIKMYAWEMSFARMIDAIRKKEVYYAAKVFNLRSFLLSLTCISNIAVLLTLVTYTYLGNTMTASKVFVVTTIYNYLSLAMGQFWPESIQYFVELVVAMGRIQSFLQQKEQKSNKQSLKIRNVTKRIWNNYFKKEYVEFITPGRKEYFNSIDKGLKIINVTASWSEKLCESRGIFGINLELTRHSLCIVVGPVGSGKSSLLNAIIGELEIDEGTIEIKGKLSYASQEPWLFKGTIRQNIVFIEEYDEKRYREVCSICALDRDFQLMPHGDQTMVGEKGVTLSGGQKARVNLARAIYKLSDIYLLDDPLSAVDAHVSKHIFNECILKYLKLKCVILVTHQIQFTKNIENVVFLDAGHVISQGKHNEFIYTTKPRENSESEDISFIYDKDDSCTMDASTHEHELNDENDNIVYNNEYHTLKSYFRSAQSTTCMIYVILISLVSQAALSYVEYYIALYINWEESVAISYELTQNSTLTSYESSTRHHYVTNYIIFTVIAVVLVLMRYMTFFKLVLQASINIHNRLFSSIIRTTVDFFQKNSSGRIINRFVKDIDIIDDTLPCNLSDTMSVSNCFHGNYYFNIFFSNFIFLYFKFLTFSVWTQIFGHHWCYWIYQCLVAHSYCYYDLTILRY